MNKYRVVVPEHHEGDKTAEAVDALAFTLVKLHKNEDLKTRALLDAIDKIAKTIKRDDTKFKFDIQRDTSGRISQIFATPVKEKAI
jgi:hypothetical protein